MKQGAASVWLRPETLEEAVKMHRASGGTVLGGGAALASSAFPVEPTGAIIDLATVSGLDHLSPPRLGAMVTLERLLANSELRDGWPAVWQAAAATAHAGVRRLATIGGTVAARLPTSDLMPALCAHGASVTLAGESDSCTVALIELLHMPPAGIVTEITLGPPAAGAYRRLAARAGFAPALAAVAGVANGQLALWAGAVAQRPLALERDALPEEEALLDDARCSAWYRRRLLSVLRDEVCSQLGFTTPDQPTEEHAWQRQSSATSPT